MFQNITSYLGECRCGVYACVCILTCACVDRGAVMFKNIKTYLVRVCAVCKCGAYVRA